MFGFGVTWTFHRRAVRDRTGDRDDGTSFDVAGCVSWPEGDDVEDFGRVSFVDTQILAVPKTGGVVVTDQPQSPDGRLHTVTGKPRWVATHPITGTPQEYDLFQIKAVT